MRIWTKEVFGQKINASSLDSLHCAARLNVPLGCVLTLDIQSDNMTKFIGLGLAGVLVIMVATPP